MSKDDGNVVDLIKHINEMKEDQNDPGYIPEDGDIEAFLKVLDFVRTLSISNTGRVEFDSDSLKITLINYVTEEEVNTVHGCCCWWKFDG